jgi:hypothetical protein
MMKLKLITGVSSTKDRAHLNEVPDRALVDMKQRSFPRALFF